MSHLHPIYPVHLLLVRCLHHLVRGALSSWHRSMGITTCSLLSLIGFEPPSELLTPRNLFNSEISCSYLLFSSLSIGLDQRLSITSLSEYILYLLCFYLILVFLCR